MPCMRLNVLLSAFEAKFEALKGQAEPIASQHGGREYINAAEVTSNHSIRDKI